MGAYFHLKKILIDFSFNQRIGRFLNQVQVTEIFAYDGRVMRGAM